MYDADAGAPEQDHALTAPERDYAPTAPELDHALAAPEVVEGYDAPQTVPTHEKETVPTQEKQTFYNKDLPEVAITPEDEDTDKAASLIPTKSRKLSLSPRVTIVIAALVTAIVVGVAVGVGVGVGLKRKTPTKGVSTSGASTTIETATPSSTPSSVSDVIKNGMLNDSSLAVIQKSNGDRHLYFQDDAGTIRQAVYNLSAKSWKASLSYTVASDAKSHTPIAAFYAGPEIEASFVFYIMKNNSLACQGLEGSQWRSCSSQDHGAGGLWDFTAAAGSRHLAAMKNEDKHLRYAFLLYEPSSGGIALLNGSYNYPKEVGFNAEWRNISSKIQTQSNLQISAPFSIGPAEETDTVFASKGGYWTASHSLESGFNEWVLGGGTDVKLSNCSTSIRTNDTSPHDFDNLLLFENREHYINMWIENGTLLGTDPDECRKPHVVQPSTPFPYRRLAGYNDNNWANDTALSSMVFYHQLNATAFAEELWSDQVGGWDSTIVHIETA